MIIRHSHLSAPARDVWDRATTPAGINHELMPVYRMTLPPAFRGRGIGDVSPGTHLGRSWLLLGGLIPVDFDDLTIAELEPGRRFLEQSSMLMFSHWQHERIVDPAPAGCVVTDQVSFVLRRPLRWVPGLGRAVERVVGALFSHRHRRLVAHWGA